LIVRLDEGGRRGGDNFIDHGGAVDGVRKSRFSGGLIIIRRDNSVSTPRE